MSHFSGWKVLPRAQEPTSEGDSMFSLEEYLLFCFIFAVLKQGHSVSQAGLEFTVLLSQFPRYWDYRYEPPRLSESTF